MGGHVFLDGLALGVAFKVSSDLGFAVFIALLVHAFSDGLNTVSFLIKSGKWGKKGIWLLGVDALARISGAALGASLVFSDDVDRDLSRRFCWNCYLPCDFTYLAGSSCTPFISLDDCFQLNRCRNHVDFSELSALGRRT